MEEACLERRRVGERDGAHAEGEAGLQRGLVEGGGLEVAARLPLREQAWQRLVCGEEAVLRHQVRHAALGLGLGLA